MLSRIGEPYCTVEMFIAIKPGTMMMVERMKNIYRRWMMLNILKIS